MDIDNNRYTDVAVGAYKSNAAVLFKTRPLINIMGSIESKSTLHLYCMSLINDLIYHLTDQWTQGMQTINKE